LKREKTVGRRFWRGCGREKKGRKERREPFIYDAENGKKIMSASWEEWWFAPTGLKVLYEIN